MRHAAKEIKQKTSAQKDVVKGNDQPGSNELRTDPPLSEKDEVKQAEEKIRKGK